MAQQQKKLYQVMKYDGSTLARNSGKKSDKPHELALCPLTTVLGVHTSSGIWNDSKCNRFSGEPV